MTGGSSNKHQALGLGFMSPMTKFYLMGTAVYEANHVHH